MIAQIIVMLLFMANLCLIANKHGKVHPEYNFWVSLFDATLITLLLWWGGFWDVFIK